MQSIFSLWRVSPSAWAWPGITAKADAAAATVKNVRKSFGNGHTFFGEICHTGSIEESEEVAYEFGKEISVVSPRFCIETDGEPEWNVAFSVRSEKCRSE